MTKKCWVAILCALTVSMLFFAAAAENTLTLPENLTTIEAEAFLGMTSVDRFDLPAGVTEIGAGAFRDSGSPSAEPRYYFLPAGISAGAGAFDNCRATIRLNGSELPRMTYTVGSDGVTITGMSGQPVEVVIPDTIDGKPVIAIGNGAFYGKSAMSRVVIPSTVTSIGSDAFRGCTVLEDIELPSALTTLGVRVFRDAGLTSIAIPSGVTALPAEAFSGCHDLLLAELPEGLTGIGDYAFNDCYVMEQADIPSTVTSIGRNAFRYCKALTEAVVPDGVTEIAESAFIHCEGMERVTLPEDLSAIGDYAFEACYKLTQVNFPSELTSIGTRGFHYACRNQPGYPVYALPESLESIGNDAFTYCDAALCVERDGDVEALLLQKGCTLTYYDRLDFRYKYRKVDDAWLLCLTGYAGAGGSVDIPAGPAIISENAFRENDAVTAVTIPSGVTEIERYAFQDCVNLSSAVIPEGVTIVRENAFRNCSALTSVSFPQSLTTIGSDAFTNTCVNQSGVHYYDLPDGLTDCNVYVFQNTGAVLRYGRNTTTDATLRDHKRYGFTYTGEEDFRYTYEGTGLRLKAYVGAGGSVTIPCDVVIMDDAVFRDCTGLTQIVTSANCPRIPPRTFQGCANLTRVVLSEGVTAIADYVFVDCAKLTDISFPSTLTDYQNSAFNGCGSAATEPFYFLLPDNVARTIYDDATTHGFTGCNAILVCNPGSVTAMHLGGYVTFPGRYDYRFRYVGNSNELFLMKYVGASATANIPSGVELRVINDEAFLNCTHVTKVVIPDGVKTINANAFKGCLNLTDITFPDSLTSINAEAFTNCGDNAQEPFYFVLPDNLASTTYGDAATHGYPNCKAVLEVTPKSTTAYHMYNNAWFTFAGQHDYLYHYVGNNELFLMKYVGASATANIPSNVELLRLGDDCFNGCSHVTKVVIPEGVESIGWRAFKGCSMLTDITFPSTLTAFAVEHGQDTLVFDGCGALATEPFYFIMPDNVGTVGGSDANHGFTNCNAVVVCNRGSYSAERFGGIAGNKYYITYPNEYDFRYLVNGTECHLVSYVGSGGTVTIPQGTTHIEEGVFKNNDALTRVVMKTAITDTQGNVTTRGMEVIQASAFEGCSNVEYVYFPSSLVRIGARAFRHCGEAHETNGYVFALPGKIESIAGYGDDKETDGTISNASFRGCKFSLVASPGTTTASSLKGAHYGFYSYYNSETGELGEYIPWND